MDLPSYQQNEKWVFFFIKRWSVSGVVATYLGYWDYKDYIDLMMSGAHVSPEFRNKYETIVDWQKIPKNYIGSDYKPPAFVKSRKDHINILNQLGFTDPEEISRVVSKFESGLADPLNFPLMADDLSNLPPAYVQASEYDTLRDDALLYAGRLEESGNKVVLDYQKHGWHGNIQFAETLLTTTSAVNVHRNVTRFTRNILLGKDQL